MSKERIEPWDSVRRRWQDSHAWDGLESIPIETARNEVLDLCDGIDAWRQRAEAGEAQLAAVPMDALRRWFENSAAFCDKGFGVYTQLDAARDSDAIGAWLEQSKGQP